MRIFDRSEFFPESTAHSPGILKLEGDFGRPSVRYEKDVVYREADGMQLHLNLILPKDGGLHPLLVFVQGSAWRDQDVYCHVPDMAVIARTGYAVAIVEYRPSRISPFPAQIVDAEEAVKYLWTHAEEYGIDPMRTAMWGDSSGGHTALMAAYDPARPREDGKICGVVAFYPPTDISKMNDEPSVMDHILPDSPEGMLIGGKNVLENPEDAAKTVVMSRVSRDSDVPPTLIFHGTKDRLVAYQQSVLLYDALVAAGKDVTMYALPGEDHGSPAFFTERVYGIMDGFLKRVFG